MITYWSLATKLCLFHCGFYSSSETALTYPSPPAIVHSGLVSTRPTSHERVRGVCLEFRIDIRTYTWVFDCCCWLAEERYFEGKLILIL